MKPKEPEEDPARVRRLLAKQARDKLVKEIESNNVRTAAQMSGKATFFNLLVPEAI